MNQGRGSSRYFKMHFLSTLLTVASLQKFAPEAFVTPVRVTAGCAMALRHSCEKRVRSGETDTLPASEVGFVDALGVFAPSRTIQLQDRLDAALGNLVPRAVLFVFAAAEFTLDLQMSALLQAGREFSKLPERKAAMPLRPRFPRALRILP